VEVRIEPHTLERANERGASKDEINDVVHNGSVMMAKNNRLCKYKVFPYDAERNGKHYSQKRIEVIYIIENETIITITVYVFYGKWEN